MINRQHNNSTLFDDEMNGKRKRLNDLAADFAPDFGKPFGITRDGFNVAFNAGAKSGAQARFLAFIPQNRVFKLLQRNSPVENGPAHFRDSESNLALAASQETTSPGFSKCSRNRRSIARASSGATRPAGANSTSMRSSTSCSSPSGSRRICSRISTALIEDNLSCPAPSARENRLALKAAPQPLAVNGFDRLEYRLTNIKST